MAMLSSIASDHLVGSVVSLQREVDLQDVGAGLYQPEDPVALGHLLVPGNPLVLHVVINQCILHHHAVIVITNLYKGKLHFNERIHLSGGQNLCSSK